ncbi:MAG TPA: hypothetical protein DCF68_14625 [Cyanothece sp. UBA12306]|nr:hypothetical protein [Cyanothece sp. UBA12306]
MPSIREILNKLFQPKYLFLFLLTLSIVIRVWASLTILELKANPSQLDSDEQEYYRLSSNLLEGNYEFNARRTLGHVILLTILRLMTFDNFLGVQLLCVIIFSLSAPLMYLLARRIIGNNLVAMLVGLLIIFWPPYIYYGNSLYSETTVLPIFITLLILLPRGSLLTNKLDGNWRLWILCGVLLGVCMLIRPMYLLFTPFAALIIFLEENRWKTALNHCAIFALGCCLIILPWSIYMTTNAGVPILISANGGETIAGGLNPVLIEQGYQEFVTPSGRQSWFGPGKWLTISANGYLNKEELKLPYAQQDALLKKRTFNWVWQNPGSALYLESAKLLYMWGIYPLKLDKQTLFGSIPTMTLLALSIAAMIRFRQNVRQLSRFWVLPIFVSGVALISWGSWRFRQPGDLGIILLSTIFILSLMIKPSEVMKLNDNAKLT